MATALTVLNGPGMKVHGVVERRDTTRSLRLDMPIPCSVDIDFQDVTMKVPVGFGGSEKKTILKGLSGSFYSGELTAIMGPSGSGKSSLMNALTGFSTKGVTGSIQAGDSTCVFGKKQGSLRSLKDYRKKSCYILQEERLNSLFTVAESMKFAADLKLGNSLTDKLKQTVIREILEILSLTGTEDTRCGNLSGGQRKRLSIAMELIDNPPVIYLDEPTTGLDSLSSTQCMELLKRLARGGRTVVCTVHQPTAPVYALFDQVYLLAEGVCVYHGSSENTVPYLASVGLHCPVYHNPADYLLEVVNGEYGNFKEILMIENTKHDWRKKPNPPNILSSKTDGFSYGQDTITINPPNEFHKFLVLQRRCMIQLYRDWTVTHLKVLLHLAVGIILGVMFQGNGSDGSKTISNLGYLMISLVYLSYTSLMPAVLRFPQELPVLKKENFNNWYNLKTYYAAVLVTTIPVQIWYSLVYCASSYFLAGQPLEASRFFMFVLICSMTTLLSDALGNVIGTCVNPFNGTFLGAIMLCTMLVFGGYLVLLAHMNKVMRIVSYASYLLYGFEGLILCIYSGNRMPLDCPTHYCHYRYPEKLIDEFKFKYDNYWIDVTVLFVKLIAFRIIAYYTLKNYIKRST